MRVEKAEASGAYGVSDASKKTPRGWFYGAAGTRHVAIPLGKSKRLARRLVTCTTDEQADERARVVREVARLVIASGNASEIARWVQIACDGDDAKALAVLERAHKLAAGEVATRSAEPTRKRPAGWKGKPENVCFGCWDLVAEMRELREEVAALRARLEAGESA